MKNNYFIILVFFFAFLNLSKSDAQYCKPLNYVSTGTGAYLQYMSFNTFIYSSNIWGVIDVTSSHGTVDVANISGKTMPIIVNSNNNSNNMVCIIYVDWNQNGVFETNERDSLSRNNYQHTGKLNIPSSALFGHTTMRVLVYYSGCCGRSDNPCDVGGSTDGTALDLAINVLPFEKTPPTTPSNIVASNISYTSFRLDWSPSTDNVSVSGYDIYLNGKLKGSSPIYSFNAIGLNAAAFYTVNIVAKDAFGNLSSNSNNLSVNTLVDNVSPSKPTGIGKGVSTETFCVYSWNASTDNWGIRYYEVFKDNILILTTNLTKVTLNSLIASTVYAIKVQAVDFAWLKSGFSTTLDISTTPVNLNTILMERWMNISGNFVYETNMLVIPVTKPADAIYALSQVSMPGIGVNNYGVRMRGFLKPNFTGVYTFTISSDDESIFYLSTDKIPANKTEIIRANYNYSQINTVNLTSGQKYYFEVLFKQGGGSDYCDLSWKYSNNPMAIVNSPYIERYIPDASVTQVNGRVTQEMWTNVGGASVASIPVNTPANNTSYLYSLGSGGYGDNYALRIRGYIVPMTSGIYTFQMNSDDEGQFWLSSDNQPNNKIKLITTNNNTLKSTGINLVAGQKYFIEMLLKESSGGDGINVFWMGPGIPSFLMVDGQYLDEFIDTQAPSVPSGLVESNKISTSFQLNWLPSTDNLQVTSYDVYKNSVFYTSTSSSPTILVSGLTPNTAYTMSVKAKDGAGNISGASADYIVTTPSPLSISIAPASLQTIFKSTAGATLSITANNTPTTYKWKSSTVSGGPYTNTLSTTPTYTPNFATVGKYYVICEATKSSESTVSTNEVQIVVNNPFALSITQSGTSTGSFVSPAGSVILAAGSLTTVTATPANGYEVLRWVLNGTTVQTGGNSLSFYLNTNNSKLSVVYQVGSSIVDQNINDNISLYPNPCNGVLHITHAGNAQIQVYDMTGKQIQNLVSQKENEVLYLPKGLYLIKVISNSKTTKKKIIVE